MNSYCKNSFWQKLFLFIGLLAPSLGYAENINTEPYGAWYSILPPLLAIFLALITRRIVLSLLIGIIIGGLLSSIYYNVSWTSGLIAGPTFIFDSITDSWNLQVIIFLVLVLAMIAIIIVSGGLQGIIAWLAPYAKDRRSSQLVTAIMGILIFIDDYANTMIVGSAMRPITDKYNVSREKLAFLVDSTSAPVSGLAFISTWIGYEVGQFGKVAQTTGLDRDGYSIFFDIFAFRFYCILMLIFVFINILSRKEFGPMAIAERRAEETGQVSAPDANPMTSSGFAEAKTADEAHISAWTATIPILALFGYLIIGLWIDGGGLAVLAENPFAWFSFTAWREVISGSENNITVLVQGSIFGIVLAILCSLFISRVGIKTIAKAFFHGMKAARIPIVILIMAWSLKGACDYLHTDQYLAHTLSGNIPIFLFPAIIFIIAGITAIATGTSWGTMAILIPTTIPLAFQLDGNVYGIITMLTFAAILDGSIFGDHCSPLSDTTIMSAIASNCDYTHHIKTQFPYTVLVGIIAVVFGYLPSTLGIPIWINYLAGILTMTGIFYYLAHRSKRKQM